jgi:hypothetical protein
VDGISTLREAVMSVPVPGAPPRLSLDGAAVGLSFLDGALRWNHLRRLTERLILSEHRAARRVVEVDISLSMLSDRQREATAVFQELLSHSLGDPAHADGADTTVWVPVARLSWRNNAGPVDVYDAAGHRLPTLTQYETSRLIASGLYRLLRGILVSLPDARDPKKPLMKFLTVTDEPRWLIQSALFAIMTERNRPENESVFMPADGRFDEKAYSTFRAMALDIFDTYSNELIDYKQLLNVAVNDYFVGSWICPNECSAIALRVALACGWLTDGTDAAQVTGSPSSPRLTTGFVLEP